MVEQSAYSPFHVQVQIFETALHVVDMCLRRLGSSRAIVEPLYRNGGLETLLQRASHCVQRRTSTLSVKVAWKVPLTIVSAVPQILALCRACCRWRLRLPPRNMEQKPCCTASGLITLAER